MRRAQDQLHHQVAARQAAILDALPAHIALLDAQGIIVSVNEMWRQFASANVLQGPGHGVGVNYLAVCERVSDEDALQAQQAASGIRSVLAGAQTSFSLEYPCHSPTEQRWFLMTATPLPGESLQGAVVMHLNITERRQAQARIVRLNRVYAMLSGINALIVRVRDRDELFSRACRIAVEAGAFKLAWIGVIDPQTLDGKVIASYGCEQDFIDQIKLTVRDGTSADERPACRALRLGQPVICNDIATERALTEHRNELLGMGYQSMGAFPLMLEGRSEAVITLFSDESGFFDQEEITLLIELAGNLSFGLDHIDSEDTLRRFSAAMDATADAIYLVDRSSMRIIHVNNAACRMQGRTREQLLALGPEKLLSTSRAELECIYDALIASAVDAPPLELLRQRQDGSRVWVELRRHAQRSGECWTIVTLVRDITARKLSEFALAEQLEELRRWSEVTLGREGRILDLKQEVNELLVQAGQPPRYPSAES
jgi:PAS domain S-box-containing protein